MNFLDQTVISINKFIVSNKKHYFKSSPVLWPDTHLAGFSPDTSTVLT